VRGGIDPIGGKTGDQDQPCLNLSQRKCAELNQRCNLLILNGWEAGIRTLKGPFG
jgi:hypothetical protein